MHVGPMIIGLDLQFCLLIRNNKMKGIPKDLETDGYILI